MFTVEEYVYETGERKTRKIYKSGELGIFQLTGETRGRIPDYYKIAYLIAAEGGKGAVLYFGDRRVTIRMEGEESV